ncbi:MAG: hypothetical protein IJH84_27720 [Saccharopolyspora sp.]|uniref:dihydroorotate dehydrogenase n=1 Tax=Saccharopolyspora sp. TaxID=33915 RepID=UPI0025FB8D4C|nr:hypothetical protein [Saccharopolyspora sp.]MBQ6644789.1 hypothetical protein [Saccharopolyspora sp.]
MSEPANRSAVEVLGLTLSSPLVVGSGLLTDQERNTRRLLAKGAGAVVTKTIHPAPGVLANERLLRIPTGMLNSTTYSRRAVDEWCGIINRFAEQALPVIVSIHARSPGELGALAEQVVNAGAQALELGIACMNEDETFEDTPDRVYQYTAQVRARVSVKISAKLAIGGDTRGRAEAAIFAGADAITLSDTIPGLAVETDSGQVHLGDAYGYSGPSLKPMVLAEIFALRNAGFDSPILGSGGVQTCDDIVDYLSVGANVVQVYTALHRNMYDTLVDLHEGLTSWLDNRGTTPAELFGRSLDRENHAHAK